jgi:hypothetical protein
MFGSPAAGPRDVRRRIAPGCKVDPVSRAGGPVGDARALLIAIVRSVRIVLRWALVAAETLWRSPPTPLSALIVPLTSVKKPL